MLTHCHLSQRERQWRLRDRALQICSRLPVRCVGSPFGRAVEQSETERARPFFAKARGKYYVGIDQMQHLGCILPAGAVGARRRAGSCGTGSRGRDCGAGRPGLQGHHGLRHPHRPQHQRQRPGSPDQVRCHGKPRHHLCGHHPDGPRLGAGKVPHPLCADQLPQQPVRRGRHHQ